MIQYIYNMITSDGKTLLVKYLLGQAPSMASHIAVGCGPNPPTNTTFYVTNVTLTSSTTVTLTTSVAHGLTTSDYIAVKDVGPFFDGVYAVASVPTTTTLTYTLSSAPIVSTTALTGTLTTAAGLITSVSDVSKLYVGQEIQKTSGAGTYSANPIILAINPTTSQLTLSVGNTGTTGSITFQSNAVMNIGVSPSGTITKTYTSKKTLDMEMFRIPIESRGYIIENGIPKMTFSGRLPQEERYEITELGLYSAGSNPSSGAYGSKNIFNFSANESWNYYNGFTEVSMPSPSVNSLDNLGTTQVINNSFVISTTGTIGTVTGAGPYVATITNLTSTTGFFKDGVVTATAGSPGTLGAGTVTVTAISPGVSITVSSTATMTAGAITNITATSVPLKVNSDNAIFTSTTVTTRSARYERCRYLGSNTMIPGNWSTYTGGALGGNYIVYNNFNIDVSQFMPNDELRLAFSVINLANSASNPTGPAYVTLEFVDSNFNTCRFIFSATASQLATSRYNVSTKTISQGTTSSSAFSWANVNKVKVYSIVSNAGGTATDGAFFICLDTIRFENKTVDNPLYKLVAYSPIMSSTGATLIKDTGTANSIQFKMGIVT